MEKGMSEENNLAEMYASRRRRLSEGIDEGIALIDSAGMAPDPALFDKNLYYLTGLTSKEATLILAPAGIVVDRWETLGGPELGRGRKVNELLFVEGRDEREAFMDGALPSHDDLQASTGIADIYSLSKLNEILGPALMEEKVLWLNTPDNPGLGGRMPSSLARMSRIRHRYYWLRLENIAPKIHEMRRVKEPYEIDCLRRAFELHAQIFEKIMRSLKPGENESLGQAIFDYEVKKRAPKFSTALDSYHDSIIVAAGKNAAVAHYMDNNQEIQDGDLVLIDSGVACNGYSSDITVTFPANGRYTPRQRELYAIVLEAEKKAIDTMRPGSSALDAHQAIYEHFDEHGLAKYGYGRAGHPNGDGDIPYEPGVVLVIEPFLVIPEEGIGIRIESGVLITEEGHEVLAEPPREIEEVEALCRRD
jgi:Xaa-Pro aminopeptidase